MQRTRVFISVFVITAVCLLFVFRGRPVSSGDKPVVALVMKSLANEFFLTMEEGAKAHNAVNYGKYELRIYGLKDEQAVSQQINIMEHLITTGTDAVIIAPADSRALIPVCIQAMERGIVVINIDNRFDAEILESNGVIIPFAGPDNQLGAELAGRYAASRLNRGDLVAIIEGIPTAYNSEQRTRGYRKAMDEAGLVIADSTPGFWEMDRAYQAALSIINEYPGVRALLCANDSMALGASAAVKAASKSGVILITGFDNISAVNEQLEYGNILVTVDQHADRLAVQGIELALESLNGGSIAAETITPVEMIISK